MSFVGASFIGKLSARVTPLTMFIRDDDAGWDDARLFALLDTVEQARTPIDLAVIPRVIAAATAQQLCARIDRNGVTAAIGLHQHGWSHCNHERVERKCEFGGARAVPAQRADLSQGRERLAELFGARLDAIFTPPWNRCGPATPALLAELGFEALSRDRGAPAQQQLPELAVDIDWCKQRRAAADIDDFRSRLDLELGACVAAARPVGLMLHHAQMDDSDRGVLAQLLATLGSHPMVRFALMRQLLQRPLMNRESSQL